MLSSGMFKVLHSTRSCRLWKGRKPVTRNLFDMFWSSFVSLRKREIISMAAGWKSS
ncbi:hypothetical protein Hanom_Chr11g01055281 [Helianthus anomalus]